LAQYDEFTDDWKWEGGRITGVVTHWKPLSPMPEKDGE